MERLSPKENDWNVIIAKLEEIEGNIPEGFAFISWKFNYDEAAINIVSPQYSREESHRISARSLGTKENVLSVINQYFDAMDNKFNWKMKPLSKEFIERTERLARQIKARK